MVAQAAQVVEEQTKAAMQGLAQRGVQDADENAEVRIREQSKQYFQMLDTNAQAMRDQQIIAEREMHRLKASAESRLAEEAKALHNEREATLQQLRTQMDGGARGA